MEHIAYGVIHITMTRRFQKSGSLLLLLTVIAVNNSFEQYIDYGDILGVIAHSIKNC